MTIPEEEEAEDYKKYLAYQDEAIQIINNLGKMMRHRDPNDKKIVVLVNNLKHVISKRMELSKKHGE